MPDLLRFQADFGRALRDRARTPEVARWLAGDAQAIDRRLALYRANMVAAAAKALSAAYPVVRQAVGAEFFHALARDYQRGTPSTSGDLGDFGAGFAGFLAAFEPTRSLPWLPDLARLEWAVHQADGAADAAAWDAATLAAVAPDRQAALRLHWSPGLAVIESGWPIVRVWQIHAPGHDGDFSVDWTAAETALVARDGFAVAVRPCCLADAAFLQASLAGAALGDAAVATLERHPGFDLGALLARAVRDGLVCGFTD